MSAIAAHRRARVVLVGVLVLLTGWFLAPTALAHDVLIDSDPAEGEVLAESPEALTLTFNNPPLEVGSAIVVEDVDGEPVVESEGVVEGTEVRLELSDALPNGDYTVAWRVASSDGHPIEGRIPFTVEAPEPEPTTEDATEDAVEDVTREPTTEPEPTTDATADEAAATGDDGGLPTWGFVLIALAALGAIGAVGLVIVRRRREDDSAV